MIDGEPRVVRQLEFARLATSLAELGSALVLPRDVIGPGIGTSSLVARYVQSHGGRYQRIIRLRAQTEFRWQTDLVRACAEWELLDRFVSRPDAPGLALRHALHTRADGLLLWLDNVVDGERIQPFIEEWDQLRRDGKPMHLVVASSEPTLQVAPLLEPICLGGLTPPDALRWCMQHAPREHLSAADVEAAAVVCECLGFHPLAIRLVALAGRASRVSLSEMLTTLQTQQRTIPAERHTPIQVAAQTVVARLRMSAPAALKSLAELCCLPEAECWKNPSSEASREFNASHVASLREWGLVTGCEGHTRIASSALRVALDVALSQDDRVTAIHSLSSWGKARLAIAPPEQPSTTTDVDRVELTWPLIEAASASGTASAECTRLLELAVDPLDRIGACDTAAGIIDRLLDMPMPGDTQRKTKSVAGWLERRGDIRLRQQKFLQARKDYRACHQLLHAAHRAESETGLRVSLSIAETDLNECRLQRAATRLVAAGKLIQSLGTAGVERVRFLMLRGAFHLQAGKTESAESLLLRADDEARQLPDDAPFRHRIRALLARTLFSLGKLPEAEQVLREDIEVRTRDARIVPLDAAVPWLMLADLLLTAGRYAEAEPLYRQVFESRCHSLGRSHRLTGETAGRLAVALALRGDFRSAEPLFREALAIHESIYGAEHPEVARILNDYAEAQFSQAKYDSAKQMLDRALSIQEQALRSSDQRVARTRNNLAAIYMAQGLFERAKDLYRRDLEIKRTRFSPQHPTVAVALNNLGNVCQSLSRFDEAEEHLEEALRIRRHHWPPDHPEVAQGLSNLGYLRLRQRRYGEALPLLREALRIRETSLAPRHPHLATTCEAIGEALFRQGELEESLTCFQRALSICEEVYGDRHQRCGHVMTQLGRVEASLMKRARAELHLRKAEQILLQSVGQRHPYYAHALCGLADLQEADGQHAAAIAALAQAVDVFRSAAGCELAASDALLAWGRILLERRVIAEATKRLTECLDVRVRLLGDEHLETAQGRLALAVAFAASSHVDRADELLDAAIAVFQRHGEAAHALYAEAITRKADVAVARSKLTDAEMLLSNRLELQTHEPAAPLERVTLLSRLAGVRYLREDYAAAVPLIQECIGIIERERGKKHLDLVSHLDNLAGVYFRLGRLDEAESLVQRALGILEHEHGENHAAVLELLGNYASLLTKCDRRHEADKVRNRIANLQHRNSHVLDEIM